MTKIEMSRRIVKQLYRMDDLPPADHFKVKRQARAPKAVVEHLFELAVAAEKAAASDMVPERFRGDSSTIAKVMALASRTRRLGTGTFRLVRNFMSGQITSDHPSEAEAIATRDSEIAEGKTWAGNLRPSEHRIYEITEEVEVVF